ncbi:MAG TPA: BTAD domain-containing putative transcriptional regulator [Mycobacteriales bacterium]|nr:BTAD domain-containing putative transcriptional regulator [Mycobacteriales bacterium]
MLGPIEATTAGGSVNLGVRKQRLVFAVLALGANQPVTIDRLVDLVWPDDPPATARGMLHSYVSRLRAALRTAGTDRVGLARVDSGYELRCDPSWVDAHRFTTLLAEARASTLDERRLALLDRALALWRGPALAGIAPAPTWAQLCQGLEEARLAAIEDQVEVRLRLARHDRLVDELLALTGEYPHRPRLTAALMLALHRTGRTGEALRVYQVVRRRLGEELGLEPPAELRNLQVAILRGDRRAGGGTVALTDRPQAGAVPRQLPAGTTTFTGRTAQLRRLRAAHRPSAAVTTISVIDGMAGIGKTALAVHAAHQLADHFPDGQMFVDLHGFSEGVSPLEPTVALDRLLRTLGTPVERIPADTDGRAALLRTRLANRRMLIVLDNAVAESQLRPLLPGRAGCLVLVTSRQRLSGLDDAYSMSLDVLPVSDAARLFTRITGIRSPSATERAQVCTIVELCGRLPLAIRIAAARLSARPAWTPAHLVELLRDGPDRLAELRTGQRSVATAFQLSYRRLGPEARRVFRLLGLHPDRDVDVDAVVALAGRPARCVRRLLEDLVDANLLQPGRDGRYRLHDLLGEHARSLARAEGLQPARRAALIGGHRLGAAPVTPAGV